MEADEKLLKDVITVEKSWVFQYDPQTKQHNCQWKSVFAPRPKKAPTQRSQVKVMLITFFDHQEMMYHEFVPQGQAVNQHFYKEVLTCLVNKIHQKRRGSWAGKTWILHHHNAPAHTALSVKQFLVSKEITTLHHPPYSPDLAPYNSILYKAERDSQADTLPRSREYQDMHDETPQNHCKRRIFTVLQSVVKKNGKVHQRQ